MRHSDNLNGTFTNPLIFGDYPDPDIIRVGEDFYLVSSSFTCAPGIPVHHSRDLINWRIIGHVYDRLPESNPAYSMQHGLVAYRGGSWAPFIRHRAGKFYIGYCTPAEGFFMAIADRPEGPYEIIPFGVELYDPGLLFDEDGRVYLAHGANGIQITELTADARAIKADPVDVFQTPVGTPLEGSHLYQRNGWYYLCLTSRGYNGMQLVLRARQIYGPYEWRIISADDLNYAGAGLHQGGFVELESGETWFFLFQDRDYLGRVPVLLPVRWEDDWPLLGEADNYGKVPVTCRKPSLPELPPELPVTSDEFDSTALNLVWHWNHNPDDTRWSLTERPGWLRLKPSVAPDFLKARNTLMQKIIGPTTSAITRLDASQLEPDDLAGLAVANIPYAIIGVRAEPGGGRVIMVNDGREIAATDLMPLRDFFFRVEVLAEGTAQFAYGRDDQNFIPLGEPFVMQFTPRTFLGNRFGLFCYRTSEGDGGYADFDYLHLETARPANRFSAFEKIPAVTYDAELGTDTQRPTEKRPMQYLINLNEGDWVRFDQIDFGEGAARFMVRAAPIGQSGRIEIRLGHESGEMLGACDIPPNGNLHDWTGDFAEYACDLRSVSGLQSICLRFTGRGRSLFRLDWFQFSQTGIL